MENSLIKNSFKPQPNDKFFLLSALMVTVYPLLVIPNPVGYNTLPRYTMLTILALIAIYPISKSLDKIKHPSFIFLGLFLLCSLISTILAPNPSAAWLGMNGVVTYVTHSPEIVTLHVSVYRFTGFSTYFFSAILFIAVHLSKTRETLLKLMFITGAIVSLLAVLQHFGLNLVPHLSIRTGISSYGTMGNPNFLGTYTVFLLPGVIIHFLKYKKVAWLICLALIYAALLVSTTRGAWIAFLVVFVVIIGSSIKKPQYLKSLGIVALTIILTTAILLPTNNGIIYRRASSIPVQMAETVALNERAGSGRLYIWQETVKLLEKHWLFGLGPEHLAYANIVVPNSRLLQVKAHNIFLEISATMGIPALISYLLFLLLILKQTIIRKDGFIYFTMILAYLLQGFFNIDTIMVMPLFWIVLGLSLAPIDSTQNSSEGFSVG